MLVQVGVCVCAWQEICAKIVRCAMAMDAMDAMESWQISIVSPWPDSGGETDATFAGLGRLDSSHTRHTLLAFVIFPMNSD